jgi:hypothetical protein
MTREEAINQLGWLKCKTNKERHLEALDMAIEALKNERPKGHWVKKWSGNGWNEDWDYTCSVCGKEYRKASSILYHASYCPNCGADMRGESDD